MQPDAPADRPLPTDPAPTSPARGQRPWHQPKLTQVALQVTGQGSGGGDDGNTPATSNN